MNNSLADLSAIGTSWIHKILVSHVIYAAVLIMALYVWEFDLVQSIRLLKMIALTEMAFMGTVTLWRLGGEKIDPHKAFYYLSLVATTLCIAVFCILLTSFLMDAFHIPNAIHIIFRRLFGHGLEKLAENVLSTTPIYFFLLFNIVSYCCLATTPPPEQLRKNRVMYLIACVDIPCAFAITVLFVIAYSTDNDHMASIDINAFISGALALVLIVSNTVNRALEVLEARYIILKTPNENSHTVRHSIDSTQGKT